MDYLNLHECYYAFLALQPHFFYPRKLIFLNEGELQALPIEEQKICVSLPQVPTNVVHKDFFDFIDMTRDEYNKMRGNSVREVAGTHGNISFRDVLLFHQEE